MRNDDVIDASVVRLPITDMHKYFCNCHANTLALTIYQYGPHPLLGDGILDHQFFWYLQDIHCRFPMNDGHV
jgi:hypothetical protein